MSAPGETQSAGFMNLSHAVKAMDIDLKPGGNLTVTVPQFKICIPDIRLKLWFLPFLRLKGIEVTTEQTTVQLNLDTAHMHAEIREPSLQTERSAVDTCSTVSEQGSVISGKETT